MDTPKKHFPMVGIEWHDHQSNDEWQSHANACKALPHHVVHTVGWLIDEDDVSYLVVMNIDPVSDLMSMMMRIYKGTFTKYKVLAK